MFSFLRNEESTPRADVFFGIVGSQVENGFVNITGNGDTAIITFKDLNKNEHKGKIKVIMQASP